jgi:hypothetical protein
VEGVGVQFQARDRLVALVHVAVSSRAQPASYRGCTWGTLPLGKGGSNHSLLESLLGGECLHGSEF